MKKKQIYALLTATVLMATSITGCSGKATEETAVEERPRRPKLRKKNRKQSKSQSTKPDSTPLK